jgi:hypothetical protein
MKSSEFWDVNVHTHAAKFGPYHANSWRPLNFSTSRPMRAWTAGDQRSRRTKSGQILAKKERWMPRTLSPPSTTILEPTLKLPA